MSEDFKKYLATEVLSEQRTISYRNVSRALKVHVNAAKCMLYEFYEFQNGKKPGSVYATYLLSGKKKQRRTILGANGTTNGHKHHYNEDDPIPSSPPPFTSSMLEPSQQSSQAGEEEGSQVPVRTVTLVREEALEAMKEQYETITSIHIYSLSPARLQDLVTLTDIGRGLFTDVFAKEDPLEHNRTYGVIQNAHVRRRKGKRPVVPQGPAPKFQPVKEETKSLGGTKTSSIQAKATAKPSTPASKHEEPSRPSSRDSTSTTASAKKPTLKRDASDLFKAFAKQGQQKPESTPSRAAAEDQDTKMNDAVNDDEGESEDEAVFLDTGTRKPATSRKRLSDAKKEREDKAAKLRKMMESDDEDEPAAPGVESASDVKQEPVAAKKDTDADGDDEEVAWSDSDAEKQPPPASKGDLSANKDSQQPAASAPRRRRGKRKVMKKRTTKDEDGYLVTKEEPVWESYSEDEPEPAPPKKEGLKSSFGAGKSHGQSHSQGQGQSQGHKAGGKAGAKKAGGGNIMSFFGKKS